MEKSGNNCVRNSHIGLALYNTNYILNFLFSSSDPWLYSLDWSLRNMKLNVNENKNRGYNENLEENIFCTISSKDQCLKVIDLNANLLNSFLSLLINID